MSEENLDLLKILDGTVDDVVATLDDVSENGLVALYDAENMGEARKSLLKALDKRLQAFEIELPTRRETLEEDIAALENGLIDMNVAKHIHQLRDELAALSKDD